MRELDKVIGYEKIKSEMYRIIDILQNPEKYKALGASIPKGILLDGEPGIGKTLLAKCFVKESGRKSFVIKKDRPDGAFVDQIRETFEKAAEEAPSIILLDDLDKFANEDKYHCDAEEYVTVQACIDEVKETDVFVIATTNNMHDLPDSLVRHGRFDKIFRMRFPRNEDAKKIISFYLQGKKVADDIDVEEIARFSVGHSCADLETVINIAAVYAGYENKEFIGQEDLKNACLREFYHASNGDERTMESYRRAAVHEAGHAVVSEYFQPGSVNFASIVAGGAGLVCRHKGEEYSEEFRNMEAEVIIDLAGKAATELILGETDMGANRDLHTAFDQVGRLLDNVSAFDFYSWCHGEETSSRVFDHLDDVKGAEMTRYYLKTKQILGKNRAFLEEMIEQLIEKKTLSFKDIALIRDKYLPGVKQAG